jgi:hypothetical protein
MKYVPHEYQTYATNFILEHPVAAVLLDMGLGKSVITLTAIEKLMRGVKGACDCAASSGYEYLADGN